MLRYELRPELLKNYEQVCRFCLSADDCHPIVVQSAINESLAKAADILVLKVDFNDGLPNNICQRCFRIMADYLELEERCIHVYEELIAVRGILGEQATADQPDNGTLKDEPKSSDEDDRPTDESTPRAPESGGKRRGGKMCFICGKKVSQLSKHMPVHSDQKKYRCEYCGKLFAHDTTLRKHLNIHLNIRNYKCELCGEQFCDRSSLRYHEAKHRNERKFECAICSKTFFTSSTLLQHRSAAHEKPSHQCPVCNRLFRLKHHLTDHMNFHSDERPFKCNACGKTFKRAKNLRTHQLSVHDEQLLPADVGV